MNLPQNNLKFIPIVLEGPYKFFDENWIMILNHKSIEKAGIYFWTININEEHLINYIGISSKCIKDRLIQHIKNFLSGDYDIYETADLEKGKMTKKYVPDEDYTKYLMCIDSNLSSVLGNLRTFNLFFASVNESKNILELIESEIISRIRESNGQAKSLLSNYRLSRISSGKLDIEINFSSKSSILGLPDKIYL